MSRSDDRAPDWLAYDDAVNSILDSVVPIGSERLPIDDVLGFASAETLESRVDHPPWDGSAMDGYAVRAGEIVGAAPDTPIRLEVSDDIPAGAFPSGPLAPGTVARVMTGAPVPEGATGVVRVEHTLATPNRHQIQIVDVRDGERNIRRRGEDVRVGDPVVSSGDRLDAAAIGLLALTGHADLRVGRRPTIAILATGDELVGLDEIPLAISGRKIMNSNTHALAAQVRSAGGLPHFLGIARDDPKDIRARIEEGLTCDALISTGGVSVGEHDHVKDVLRALGAERIFWRARVRPGSPIFCGRIRGKPFWGLPGNPVSAMVTFEVFLRAAIRKMGGHRPSTAWIDVRVRDQVKTDPRLTHFQRVYIHRIPGDLPEASLTGSQSSGILSSMKMADALLIVPEGEGTLPPGTVASALPLGCFGV